MAGDISSGPSGTVPVTQEDLSRLYEAGALSLDGLNAQAAFLGGIGRLPIEDVRARLLSKKTAASGEQISDSLLSLRKELRDFVKTNNREGEGFGFGVVGGDPLNCSTIMRRVAETVGRLEAIGEERTNLTPLAAAQHRVIPQLTAVMEEFLVDLGSITTAGEAGRSAVVPVLKACIQLSRVVGEVVHALSAMKMEMSATAGRS